MTMAPPLPTSTDEVLEALEMALEAIDGLRAQVDELTSSRGEEPQPPPDERPDRLLAEVDRLHERVEQLAEASWRQAEDDRLGRALDAIEALRIRVDDTDPTEAVARTLDAVGDVAARLDTEDATALTELTIEAVEDLRERTARDTNEVRTMLDRAVAGLDALREEAENRDPGEGLELALEAVDDVRSRIDARADATDLRLEGIEAELTGLTRLAGSLAGAVAELAAPPPVELGPAPIDDRAIAAIADRVASLVMARFDQLVAGSADRVIGRLDASTDRVLGRLDAAVTPPAVGPGEPHAAVVASAAAAMSRLEGRLDSEFGSVERSVARLDQHLAELETLLRPREAPSAAETPADPPAGRTGASEPAGDAVQGRSPRGDAAARLRTTATAMLNSLRATRSRRPQ
jgi:hypothetical protein